MNSRNKRAGQSTRELADKRYRARLRFALLVLVIGLVILAFAFNLKALGIGGIGILGSLIIARFFIELIMGFAEGKAQRMMKEEDRAIRGAKAEERIGSIVDELDENFMVVHDVESPYGNIDHIVIGKRSGVFLIETKAHGGRVSVENGCLLINGHRPEKDFIAQALKNTYWLRDIVHEATGLKVWITPIIAFTNAFVEPTAPIKGVRIINKRYLLNVLERPNARSGNFTIWENRDTIVMALDGSS